MKKFVIVEDERILSLYLKNLLNNWGYSVSSVYFRGEDFLDTINPEEIDMILMDINLGDGIDGIDTATVIKEKYDISSIFITAFADEKTVDKAKKANPAGFIVKPFREEELRAKLEIALYVDEAQKNKRKAESELFYMAKHDSLTDLPNRYSLKEKIYSIINLKKFFFLFLIDVDNFKFFNDNLGNYIGDMILQKISEKLKKFSKDDIYISRTGGDEFALVLEGENKNVSLIADELIKIFENPIVVNHQEFFISISFGISKYPDDGNEYDEIYRKADIALFEAKRKGKKSYLIFRQNMQDYYSMRIKLEKELYSAVNNDEFVVYYQPKLNIELNKITGLEALIRWNHRIKGIVNPGEFIELAEETGIIIEMGYMLIKKITAFMRKNEFEENIKISFNVSSVQFRDKNFIKKMESIIKLNRIDLKNLEMEITENAFVEKNIIGQLEIIKKSGLDISIDDFGTGYSSLSYLTLLPIDVLKIDMSFIKNIENNHKSLAITKTIIEMAKNMNFRVIAEGVENKRQLDILYENNCNEIQGYYVSKPLPENKIIDFINKYNRGE